MPRAAGNSNGGHATIDWEVYACDEACFVRSEEQGGRRDLLRAAEPPERDGRGFTMTPGGVGSPPGHSIVYVFDILDVR